MTTVATRARRIAEFEGFDIIVMMDDIPVSLKDSGILGPYPYEKAALNRWTIGEWISKRFETCYDGYTCDVLMGDGNLAKLNKTLGEVRESYYE